MSTEFNEKARWAKLAGLPKVEEESKQQLDENVVGIGAINQIFPTREPNDYEMAFEHFLGERYTRKTDDLNEAAAENLELKSFTKQLYSYAKKNGAQAFLVDYSKQENPKTLGTAVKDQTKPSVFISINKDGNVSVRMVGAGVDQLYKDMVNSYSKFEFGEYKYVDKQAFPPYEGVIPGATFTVKSKTTGKKGGVAATE